MKNIYRLFSGGVSLLVFVVMMLSSCDKMDDIQRRHAEKEEQVYLGKVDSIRFFPGFGRVKLTWYIGSGPKVDRTIIYWNMRRDSVVKAFTRTVAGMQKDSIILENVREGTTLFEFRNVNDEGETSLYSSASVTVWGETYADGLNGRKLVSFDFDYANSKYKLGLSPVTGDDGVVYSHIAYTNSSGQGKTVKIERTTNEIELEGLPAGGAFRFRTVFFLPEGMDTVYNSYLTLNAPTAVTDRGTKLPLAGNMGSKYFERNGERLYEWTDSGVLLEYTLSENGSLPATGTPIATVPRSTYRDFFFYDDDKFIGITVGHVVRVVRIVNGEPVIVRTPSGSDDLGSGFSFPLFIPARGYFFSVAAGTGELKTWLARENATWGSPNGATVGTGFSVYEPLALFNNETLLGVDADGYLWSTPVSISGTPGSKSRIGIGWDRFKKVFSVGTKVLGMEENGDLYVFDHFNTADKYWIVR